jgi:transposase
MSKGSGKGSGVSRSDRRRNARRERLRSLLPRDGVVLGIDLGEVKQAVALVDHDVRVLWRKSARVPAHRLGEVLDLAVAAARVAGFTRVTVACEPTGSRWMQVQRLCGERGLPLVCVQPLVSYLARAQQDLTGHKRDEPDSVMIGRLATELHCYVPEELDQTWGYLRQLGRRREQLVRAQTASVLRIRDALSVAWPSVLTAAGYPFGSLTWLAAVQAVTGQCGADPARLAGLGEDEFAALVAQAGQGWGLTRPARAVTGRVRAVLDDPDAVSWSRRGLFRRVSDELADLCRTRAQLRAAEADMGAVLTGELGLARLAGIPGLSLTGAAVILAQTGDPARYETSSSMVKQAGLSPADNASGQHEGQSHITRRGRPALRTGAWRAVFPLLRHNPVMAAKFRALTDAAAQAAARSAAGARPGSAQAAQAARAVRSARGKAQVACAASLLRWIYFMTVHNADWDPVAASGGRQLPPATPEAA